MQLDVYISCSRRDKTLVETIGNELKKVAITFWYALRGHVIRMEMPSAVEKALDKASIVILVLSSNYINDSYIHSDIRRALEKGKPIIVYAVEDIDYPEMLHNVIAKSPKKSGMSVIPIDAWKVGGTPNQALLINILLVFLGRTEEEKQFQASLKLDYYSGSQILFPQIGGFADEELRDKLNRAVSFLNIENVDIGLFLLSKEFEAIIKQYVEAASFANKLHDPPKGTLTLDSAINCIYREGIITDRAVMHFLRQTRNDRAHGTMPSPAERQLLMNDVKYIAGMYVGWIKYFKDLYDALIKVT